MNHLALDLEQALDDAAHTGMSRAEAPRALLQPASLTGLVRLTCEEWTMIGLLWALVVLAPGWLYAPLLLLLAGRFHALGVILHDAAHMPLRGKTASVRFVEIGCGYPIATTLNAMRYHHLRHHRDTGMASDPYHKPAARRAGWRLLHILRGVLLVPFWTLRAAVGTLASFYPPLRNFYARVFLQDRSRTDLRHSAEVRDCARAERGQLAAQSLFAMIVLAFPQAAWWGYLAPVTLAGLLAARRVVIEHTHADAPDRRIETILATTRDNHLGWLGAAVLAPRNIGYHVVHHLHPQAGLQALPRLRQWYANRHGGVYPVS